MTTTIKLIRDNCLNVLSFLECNSVDLCFTSPPYNMNLRIRDGKHCSRQIVKELTTKYKNYDDNLSMEEYYELNCRVIDSLIRICGLVFYNIQFLTGNKSALYKIIGRYSDQIKEFIVWDKVNSQPAIGNGVMNSQWEAILVFSGERKCAISRKFKNANFDRGELSNLWRIKRGRKLSTDHGASFPIELAEEVILRFSKEGDTIIDPFMGTGTTGIVCKKNRRNFIGIEIDKDYFDFSSGRIKERDLFDDDVIFI